MKLHSYAETDSLSIELSGKPGADAEEIAEGVVVDFDAAGGLVGVGIEHAAERLELETLETVALPLGEGPRTVTKSAREQWGQANRGKRSEGPACARGRCVSGLTASEQF